ncbi:hypothetical protein BD779DRAFT_343288 [Infundibulicybe gibba]|nr:hypothetical protein BD779DRAFT_343288 [Infundibulicybe gibba]
MTSSSAGDGVVFVPRHPRFNPHQLPAGAAGPFKAVRARRTIPKADVPPPADDATPEDSKAIPTDVSAAASNATPVVSQVLFGDGKTLLAPNEACMNAWEAIPNRGTKLIDEKATTPTPATIKASSGSVSNVLYSSGPLTTSRNGTLVPSSRNEDVSDVSTGNFKALARLGHRIQSSPGETNKDNKPSALPHHCAQPSKAGPLVHSNTVHRGSPVPPAYATSLNHGNLGVDDTDSRYVFSWHMTSIIKTGLQIAEWPRSSPFPHTTSCSRLGRGGAG